MASKNTFLNCVYSHGDCFEVRVAPPGAALLSKCHVLELLFECAFLFLFATVYHRPQLFMLTDISTSTSKSLSQL